MLNRAQTILAFVIFCVGAEYHWNKQLENGETISALCGACRDQKVQSALGKCWQKTGRCPHGCIDGKLPISNHVFASVSVRKILTK